MKKKFLLGFMCAVMMTSCGDKSDDDKKDISATETSKTETKEPEVFDADIDDVADYTMPPLEDFSDNAYLDNGSIVEKNEDGDVIILWEPPTKQESSNDSNTGNAGSNDENGNGNTGNAENDGEKGDGNTGNSGESGEGNNASVGNAGNSGESDEGSTGNAGNKDENGEGNTGNAVNDGESGNGNAGNTGNKGENDNGNTGDEENNDENGDENNGNEDNTDEEDVPEISVADKKIEILDEQGNVVKYIDSNDEVYKKAYNTAFYLSYFSFYTPDNAEQFISNSNKYIYGNAKYTPTDIADMIAASKTEDRFLNGRLLHAKFNEDMTQCEMAMEVDFETTIDGVTTKEQAQVNYLMADIEGQWLLGDETIEFDEHLVAALFG